MTLRADWLVYKPDFTADEHSSTLAEASDVPRFLAEIKPQRAEEVLVRPEGEAGERRHLTFQLDDSKTRAYVYYAQAGGGSFEAVGDPDAPELYTSSGGSFSAGTAVPLTEFERALVEFLETDERPTCLEWTEED